MTASIWNHLQGVEFKQTYYNANGVRTRAIEAGSGPVLIFLHGTGGHAEAYMKNIASHAEHFHVFAIDLVGHGYSDTAEVNYGMQCYVDHLRDFMDAAGIDQAHLSGESMGASVAAWFANQYPERVRKLVLNTGIPLAPPPGSEGAQQLQDLLDRSRKATGELTREAVQARVRWLVYSEADVSEEIVETRFAIYSQAGRAAAIRQITEQSIGTLLDPAAQSSWYSPDNLKQLTCPVLVLWTNHNPGQPVELAKKGAALIPNHQFAVLDNSAHWPQWEEADKFNQLHIEFLRN